MAGQFVLVKMFVGEVGFKNVVKVILINRIEQMTVLVLVGLPVITNQQ